MLSSPLLTPLLVSMLSAALKAYPCWADAATVPVEVEDSRSSLSARRFLQTNLDFFKVRRRARPWVPARPPANVPSAYDGRTTAPPALPFVPCVPVAMTPSSTWITLIWGGGVFASSLEMLCPPPSPATTALTRHATTSSSQRPPTRPSSMPT